MVRVAAPAGYCGGPDPYRTGDSLTMPTTQQEGTVHRDVSQANQHALARKIHAHWQETQ